MSTGTRGLMNVVIIGGARTGGDSGDQAPFHIRKATPGRPEFDAVRQRAVFKEALGTLQQAIEELGDATTGKATALG